MSTGEGEALDISIRPARFDDLDGIEDLIEPFVEGGKLLPRTWDELQNLVPTGFVAEHDGRIIGFAALEIYSRKMAEVRSLCVADGYQGQGVGKRLVRACVDFATDRRVFEVMVVTSSEEFFRSCGFDFTLPGEKKALFLQTRTDP
ncbi:MAG: GNAT family N-acetyltransferase [Planctomyces sp.]|nr:GNAT family N-acetyltransferase [Planctomyces sp.]